MKFLWTLLFLAFLPLGVHWGCAKGPAPLTPAGATTSTIKIPMMNGKNHVLSNNNVAAYELYYNIAGSGQTPVTGSIGPIPSNSVGNYYDFSVNIPSNTYNLISIQVNDAQAQTVLAIGAQSFTYEPGTTLPVTIGPIHQCYYVTNLGAGYAYGFENNIQNNVGANTPTSTTGLDMLCNLNTQSTGYLLQNASLQAASVAYLGNGTWVNDLTVPATNTFFISSGQSKGFVTANNSGLLNNYPVAVGDIYCVKILSGGYAWLQITGVSVANGISFDFRPNTTQSFCGYEQSTTDLAGNCGNNNNGTPIPTWAPLGAQGFNGAPVSYVSMAFNNSGNTYVAYQDNTLGFKATVEEYNGTSWVTVGNPGFSPGPVTYLSLQVYNNTPFVAFSDGSSAGLGKAMVMEYSGSWVTVGTPGDFSSGAVSYVSLAVNGSVTYVAYSDASLNQGIVEKFNGGTWSMLGSSPFVTGGCPYTSLALNPQNNDPYVAYSDTNVGGKANVVEYNGAWVTAGNPDFSTGAASYLSLGFDTYNSDYPYVVYSDAGNGGKATLMNYYNSFSWTPVGSASGFTPGMATYNSLAFNNNGPFVAFSDGINGNQASCMAYLSGSWVDVGNPDFSGGVANFICLGQGANGFECAYQDGSHGTDATVMQFQ